MWGDLKQIGMKEFLGSYIRLSGEPTRWLEIVEVVGIGV